jgi:uncharacterized BrkB/YihY/UPF0761 family membrane protein
MIFGKDSDDLRHICPLRLRNIATTKAAREDTSDLGTSGSQIGRVWVCGRIGSLQLVGFFLSFGIISLLFAMMFKWLPDTPVAWSDVWLGAIVTAALFELGKLAIGLYIGKQGLESTYGAAASIVVVLIWVYYSSQIVLMGAEFTNVYARRYGSLRRTLSSMQNRND